MASLSLVFDLLARDRASKAFNDVGDAADRAGKKGAAFGTAIGKGLAVAGGALAGAGLVSGLKGFYDAAAESAKIGRLTAQVIKTTGGAAKISADQVGNLATAISNKTGADDEAIQSAENLLLTFTGVRNEVGKGNDIFNQATGTIVDMSAALGQDTSASAIQLGKALNDPIKGVTALSKVGVSFTKQQKDQIKTLVDSGKTLDAQKVILKELGKEFGGAAEAASTPLDKLKVNLGNLQEQIGAYLIPVVDKVASFLLTKALPALQTVGSYLSDHLTPIFGTVKDAVGQLFDILVKGDFTHGPLSEDSSITDALFNIRDAIGKTITAAKNFGSDLKTAFGNVKDTLKGALDGVTIDVSGIGSDVVAQVEKFGQPIIDGLKKGLKDGDYTQAGEAAANALTAAIKGAATAAKNITEAIGELIDKVNWGELALRFGKQAPTLVLGFVTGLLNFDIGSALRFLGDHWVEVLFAILAVAFAPAKVIGKVAEVLAKIPLVGPFLEWGLRAFKTFADNIVGFIGGMFGRFSEGFLQGGTGLISRFGKFFDDMFTYARVLASEFVDFLKAVPGRIADGLGNGMEALGAFLRKSFDAIWTASKTIALTAIGAIAVGFLNLVATILNGAADAFGWVPGLGGKLKDAAKHFDTFRDNVNDSLNGLKDKQVDVTATAHVLTASGIASNNSTSKAAKLNGLADGGMLRGPGTGRSDSILGMDRATGAATAWVSNGEYVVNARSTAENLPLLEAINSRQKLADGGGVSLNAVADSAPLSSGIQGFYQQVIDATTAKAQAVADAAAKRASAVGAVSSGGSDAIKSFIASVDPLPYIWGAVGPRGYDCSGLAGEVWARTTQHPSFRRYFTTASFTPAAFGMKPGPGGLLSLGFNDHHVVGNYGGLAFEAESTRTGIKTGPAASPVSSMPRQYHLANGGLVEKIKALSKFYDVSGDTSLVAFNERKKFPLGAIAMATGGVIQEPIRGVGQMTGRSYSFGERGPETVTPGLPGGSASGTVINVYGDLYDVPSFEAKVGKVIDAADASYATSLGRA